MGVSMAAFTTFIEQFSDVLWNSLLLFLLVGTGVYFTVRLRGVQVRRFMKGLTKTIRQKLGFAITPVAIPFL